MRILDSFRSADWRLQLYTLLVPVYWGLALGPGGGGTETLKVSGQGAALNCLLLILLWQGSKWAVTLCGLWAMVATMVIASEGIPPWGPMFGALALISGAQFLLVCTYDLGPNSDPGDAKKSAPAPTGQAS